VQLLLQEDGADPNYARQLTVSDPLQGGRFVPVFDELGAPIPEADDSLLSLVVFRLSDCTLTDEQIVAFGEIAQSLLDAGAHPSRAIRLSEERYGVVDSATWEKSRFDGVLKMIIAAAVPPAE
jgi:hypothetical protein